MSASSGNIASRKSEHLELCSSDRVAFKTKKNGFENYDFIHNAATEVEIDKINLEKDFFSKKVNYPFIISCMTGGEEKADNINLQLADAASFLNIPLGLGSQRHTLEGGQTHNGVSAVRKRAPNIPILSNIGAAQVAKGITSEQLILLTDLAEADAVVIHLNPLQELIQKEGEPNFYGLLKNTEKLVKGTTVPVIIKEVGAGISKETAKSFLNAGVKGIDTAGAGGTSWSGVEILRNNDLADNIFWDWGLPTSYCIRTISELKADNEFLLIGSGGVNDSFDAAKALALGADFAASARIIFQKLNYGGAECVIDFIKGWFEDIKKILFLTGSASLEEFNKTKLIKKKEMF